MKEKSTQRKILNTSITLFNEKGYKNVTLMDIARSCGISTGNLNYHFKKKDNLVASIYEQFREELELVLSKYRVFPDTKTFDSQIVTYFQFQVKYRFFYLDTLEIFRDFPRIAKTHYQYINNEVNNSKAIIDYGVGRGIIHPEPYPNAYDTLAQNLWMALSFSLLQHKIRNIDLIEKDAIKVRKSVWHLLIPHFTEKGIQELKEFGIIKETGGTIEVV